MNNYYNDKLIIIGHVHRIVTVLVVAKESIDVENNKVKVVTCMTALLYTWVIATCTYTMFYVAPSFCHSASDDPYIVSCTMIFLIGVSLCLHNTMIN